MTRLSMLAAAILVLCTATAEAELVTPADSVSETWPRP